MSTSLSYSHCSVMTDEVLLHLAPRPGGVYCDATLGGGGHTELLLVATAPSGRVLGIDRDPSSLRAASERLAAFGDRFTPIHGRFGDLPALLLQHGVDAVDGIIADIGVSSPQLERPERGFSFTQPGPIDMRMDPESGEPALHLIERLDERQLADILRTYGEERFALRVARAMKQACAAGELSDTVALARVIARAVPTREGKDPATRSFQALRIAVNDELRQLDRLLLAAPRCLRPGGRLVIISFHSLEDRIAKHRLRQADEPGYELTLLTRKPVLPSLEEVQKNPRARSARLRAAVRSPLP